VALVAVLAAAIAGGTPVAEGDPAASEHHPGPSADGGYHTVAGLGDVRRTASGLLAMRLDDGWIVKTHGPDSLAELSSASTAPAWLSGAAKGATSAKSASRRRRSSTCVESGEPRFHILYRGPRGSGASTRERTRQIRDVVGGMDRGIRRAGRRSSGGAVKVDFRVACTPTGAVKVSRYPGTAATPGAHLSTAIQSAIDAGYTASSEKYLIFSLSRSRHCGIGEVEDDSRRSVANLNNSGGMYGVLFGRRCWNPVAGLHETGHTMGAVQHDAPTATSRWHCYQQSDVMCYDDGSADFVEGVHPCPRQGFDCGFNDYFDALTGSGSYLATHWNLGWAGNRFLEFR
jgi:hypothetical protein